MVRTIRICSTATLLLAGMLPGAAMAGREPNSGISHYVRARFADHDHQGDIARANYRAALTLAPDGVGVAFRAYRAAVEGGDYALALRAAQALDRIDLVPPDAQLLLFVAAVRERDWHGARLRLDRIGDQPGFAFLEPLLAEWLALVTAEEGRKPPVAASAYSVESAALLLIARGDIRAGVTAVRALWPTDPGRATALRLAAAATLSRAHDREAALALLDSGNRPLEVARALLVAGKALPGAVDSPGKVAAFLLARMADDLLASGTPRSALVLSRLAQFSDTAAPLPTLAVARALIAVGQPRPALLTLASIDSTGPYQAAAATLTIDALEAAGDTDAAIVLATRSAIDPVRIGDIEMRRDRPEQAVQYYRLAMAAQGSGADWPLLLATASALDASGDWTAARPLLETALARAPDEPRLLNRLGYSLADRGEELPRALTLLERANAARPDDAEIVDSLGWAYLKIGDLRQAIALLERARTLDAVNAEIGGHLGDAYWRAGRRIEARYAWAAARETATGGIAPILTRKLANGLP